MISKLFTLQNKCNVQFFQICAAVMSCCPGGCGRPACVSLPAGDAGASVCFMSCGVTKRGTVRWAAGEYRAC